MQIFALATLVDDEPWCPFHHSFRFTPLDTSFCRNGQNGGGGRKEGPLMFGPFSGGWINEVFLAPKTTIPEWSKYTLILLGFYGVWLTKFQWPPFANNFPKKYLNFVVDVDVDGDGQSFPILMMAKHKFLRATFRGGGLEIPKFRD